MSYVLVPSKYLIYLGVSADSVSRAGFNSRMTYTLRSFVTVCIVLLIVGMIYATFCNYLCWNRDHEPYLKYEMTWWRNGLLKYRRDLMEPVAEVGLLKLGELTLGGGIFSGNLISSGEENDLGNVLDTAFARRFSLRVSWGTSDGESHVSWFWHGSDFDHYNCKSFYPFSNLMFNS